MGSCNIIVEYIEDFDKDNNRVTNAVTFFENEDGDVAALVYFIDKPIEQITRQDKREATRAFQKQIKHRGENHVNRKRTKMFLPEY